MPRLDRLIEGAEAGAAGTLALLLSDRLAREVLGRRPVFSPRRIATRLARARLHRWLRPAQARWIGALMRAGYGPMLGAVLAPLWLERTRSRLAAGAAIGLTVLGFELVALPWAGATPRLARWSAGERPLLAVHTLWYGLVTARVGRRLGLAPVAPPSPGRRPQPLLTHQPIG